MTGEILRATPFHTRAAGSNRLNDWHYRGGFTLPRSYGDAEGEALAARFGAVLADQSWHTRIMINGESAGAFVSLLFTRDATALAPGEALKALWLNDAGGVRGRGIVARFGRDAYLLIAEASDLKWIEQAGRLFHVAARDVTAEDGVLALVGPYASQVLEAAGIDAKLEPLAFRKFYWRGLDVTLSRFGEGYELWSKPDDALVVWDRLCAAGKPFTLTPAGLAATDILSLEHGEVRDFARAEGGFSPEPTPQALGLSGLVDREHVFNGRAGFLAAGPDKALTGILIDGQTPAPHAALMRDGRAVGRTLDSLYSPALRQAIALGVLNTDTPAAGLTVNGVSCRTCALPFL